MRGRGAHHRLTVTTAVVVWIGWSLSALAPLDRLTGDLLVRTTTILPDEPSPFVAVLIGDDDLARWGPLPWPRPRLARLVDTARDHGAAAVVLDLVLAEPQPGDEVLAASLGAGPSILAATIAAGGGWVAPHPRLGGLDIAAHAHAELDEDGVVRVLASTKQSGGVSLPALAVAAARASGNVGPVAAGVALRPDYRTTPEEIATVSAGSLLGEPVAPGRFEGRVVFIGVAAAAANDQMVTPVSPDGRPTPGVLVHAAGAAAIVNHRLLETAPGWSVLVVCLLIAVAVAEVRSRSGGLPVAPLALGLVLLGVLAVAATWWLHLLLPLATLLVASAATVATAAAADTIASHREVDRILTVLVERAELPDRRHSGLGRRLEVVRSLQSQLRHDRDLRQSLMDGLEEGVALWDDDGRAVLTNRAFDHLWGEPGPVDALLRASEGPITEDRDGRHLEVRVRPVGRGHLALVRDVTTAAELERRRREMQRLVSHELKTPLASLAGFGSMLERYQLDDDELRRTAGLIRREAERLGDMVRAFLDLERMEAGEADEAPLPLDLATLAGERCAVLQAAAAERGLELVTDLAPAPVDGRPTRLAQVVDNLVGNAVKYAHENGHIRVTTTSDELGCRLIVADDGPGIPAEAQPHLFERFYRVPGSPSTGSGLGLALVAEVAARHGGRVEVVSSPGQGAAFTVTLPHSVSKE